jgi:hypothetical protein
MKRPGSMRSNSEVKPVIDTVDGRINPMMSDENMQGWLRTAKYD